VVLVSLDDTPGVNLVGNVRGANPHDVEIEARVRMAFEEVVDPLAAAGA
jgi:hypothetical protein